MNYVSETMRLKEAANYLNISLATLWRYGENPDFPPKIRLSSRCVCFRKSDLDNWLKSKEA